MKIVLFDIDGTMLQTDGAGRRAIRRALLDGMGATGPIDDMRFDGKTDPQIVRDLMQAAGHEFADSEEHIEDVCHRYVALLEHELDNPDHYLKIFPGVHEALDAVEARQDGTLGLLTGNVRDGARLKLRKAGIEFERFKVGAFGSDAADRSHLPPIARDRAVQQFGKPLSGSDIVIIGDTPADVTCGAGVGARAIGVATGRYSEDELAAAGAYDVLPDLSDTDRVLEAIFG